MFKINTDGTGFEIIHTFNPNADGGDPASLALSGTTLYGTAFGYGRLGNGTVFTLNTDGTAFRVLYTFMGDSAHPRSRLLLADNMLYTTTVEGGWGDGTVFAISTDGSFHDVLYNFAPIGAVPNIGLVTNSDGAYPFGGLLLSGNTLYGTALEGGDFGYGTVFSFSLPILPPELTITPSGPNVILTWSANATGFTLLSTTNLSSPLWTPVSPDPIVINGQNTVTNPISGARQFYRLSQ